MTRPSTAVCNYRLKVNTGAAGATTKVYVLPAAPVVPQKLLPDPQAWLCDAHGAKLGGVEAARPEAYSERFLPEVILSRCSGPDLFPPMPAGIAERARQVFSWVSEALLTRFQQRPTLPFEEVRARVASASEAAGLQAWMILRALFASGWLLHIQRRTSPYQEIALGERVLVAATSAKGTHARLCGLIGENELILLRRLLLDGETCVPALIPGQLFMGAWTLELISYDRVTEIAESMGFRVRRKTITLPCPLAGALQQALHGSVPSTLSTRSETMAWDVRHQRWSDEREIFHGAPVFRNRSSQRDVFWGAHHTGTFQTDSFSWGLMLARRGTGAPLGVLADDGSVKWNSEFPAIPLPLSNWWMQEGGGSVGIGADGSILFLGGGGLGQWQGHFGHQPAPSGTRDGAADRRELALSIRRRGSKRNQAL